MTRWWPARPRHVGAIIALSPDLTPFTQLLQVDDATVRKVLMSWSVGKLDAELLLDGKAARPDSTSSATLLPAAFGLAGVALHTYTGWGSVTHWNALVANIEMMAPRPRSASTTSRPSRPTSATAPRPSVASGATRRAVSIMTVASPR
jgi:hypothetical protein